MQPSPEDHADGAPGVPGGLDSMLRQLGEGVSDALDEGAHRCGPYVLLDQVGEGGFGEVFAAARDDAIDRTVAVKVLKRGIDSIEVLRRFEMEQRALARIDHPCVAAILDAGMTEDGRPWFAMPLLDGDPVTVACDEARSTLEARLRIMMQICDGVQAAHVQGIVHRDLKPGNVLVVAGPDGNPLPKVIDFGVAKAIGLDGAAAPARTATGARLGTPEYMAPEQLAAEHAGADARSDVFALGVMMAELVAGIRPPVRAHGAEWRSPLSVSKAFGTLMASEADAARVIAERRGLRSAGELRARLSGDIEAIVAKATMPEPDRRYQSAEAMGADIRRMASAVPVLARSPSTAYFLARFVKRNRGSVVAAVAAAVSLVALSAVAVANAMRAERSSVSASQQALRAEQVTDLLRGVFERIDPEVAKGRDRTLLVDLLTGTIDRIESRDDSIDPKAAAEVVRIVADALVKLDRMPLALEAIDRALARVNSAIDAERSEDRIGMLRMERAALRVERGTVIFMARWAEAGVSRSRLDEPLASAEWRAALEELAELGSLGCNTARMARLRLWRIREAWPPGTSIESFDAQVDADMSHEHVDELERWSYRLRRAEIQGWAAVLRDYPRELAECEAALGTLHPLVVRSRNRLLDFEVDAAIESRRGVSDADRALWPTDDALKDQWRRACELAARVVADCAEVFGPLHRQTLSARACQLMAEGQLRGPESASESYATLRADAVAALGDSAGLVREIDRVWEAVQAGYGSGRWW